MGQVQDAKRRSIRFFSCWMKIHFYFIDINVLFQDDEPPEITYCVVDTTGTLSLQAITPTQPMPSQEELDSKFAELVVSIH